MVAQCLVPVLADGKNYNASKGGAIPPECDHHAIMITCPCALRLITRNIAIILNAYKMQKSWSPVLYAMMLRASAITC